ncbi:hypothetical protein [Planomonospora parontospora]|uniref:hypothetical protein n=1 Tax=Planomonospora parontospora TaxID=58119 RepID=UPI00167180E1|nr:hypothetical protein [Planomonospora parontospora]GGL49926.1 hypothetical protein GCM10014719_58940 [Planomonospora parontospora subsp. antibiotica]GII19330.1 hypothetical protein Ppa05_60560 [Planomonospora parontospora subsp. antibiotica]
MIDQPPHHTTPEPPLTPEHLCDRYGAALLDYTSLWLNDADRATETVRTTLTLAHHNAHRLTAPGHLRAWLYALARHQAAHPDDGHAFSTGPLPAVPGHVTPPPAEPATEPSITGARLAYDALSALDRRDRELLELHLRHRLEAGELAALFGQDPAAITTTLTTAADLVEAWASAIRQAGRQHPTCPGAAALARDWITAPSRGTRTKIRSHVGRCPTCAKAANLTVDATALLQHLPIAPLTPRARARILQPAAPTDPAPAPIPWTATGFPHQIDQLEPEPAGPADPALEGFRANIGTDFWADTDRADRAFWTEDPIRPPAAAPSRPAEPGPDAAIASPAAAEPRDRTLRDVLIALSARPLRAARSAALTAAALVICVVIGVHLSQPAPVQTTSARYPEPIAVPSQDPLPMETAPPPPPAARTTAPPTADPTTSTPPAPPARPRTTPRAPSPRATSSPAVPRREINPASPRPRRSTALPEGGPGRPPPPPSSGPGSGFGAAATLTASATAVDLDASGTATVTLTASATLTWSAHSSALQVLPAGGTLGAGQSTTLQILAPAADPGRFGYGACTAASAQHLTVTWSAPGATGDGQLTITVRTPACG